MLTFIHPGAHQKGGKYADRGQVVVSVHPGAHQKRATYTDHDQVLASVHMMLIS